MLTVNEELSKWFSELHIEDLREGGMIKFDMQNGTYEEMTITACKLNAVFAFTWDKGHVRFELYPNPEGCQLIFVEEFSAITNHTPRDLAGWHVCLDVIDALLDGRTIDFRKAEWELWYVKYVQALENVK